MELELRPEQIEQRSMDIITDILAERTFPPEQEPIVKRVIHTTADFDYADNLWFSHNVVSQAVDALKNGADIICDTNMAMAGINKTVLRKLGGEAHCFIADEDVAFGAKKRGITRASIAVEKAIKLTKPAVFAVGNAPTALIRLRELIDTKQISPKLVIGVPVGFVNVVEAKELFVNSDVPAIVARGRKGGSNVAAAICNALLYTALPER